MWLLLCRCHGNRSCSAAGSNWELGEKERKKSDREGGGISAGMGKKGSLPHIGSYKHKCKCFMILLSLYLQAKHYYYLLMQHYLLMNLFVFVNKCIYVLSLVSWRRSCTSFTKISRSSIEKIYALCVRSWRFISMVTAPSSECAVPLRTSRRRRWSHVLYSRQYARKLHTEHILLIQQQFSDLKLRCHCKH